MIKYKQLNRGIYVEKNFYCYTKDHIKRAFKVTTIKEDRGYSIIEVSERRVYPGSRLSEQFKGLKHMSCDQIIWRYPVLPEHEKNIEPLFEQVVAGLKADPDLDVSLITSTPATQIRINLPERDRPSKSIVKKLLDTTHPVEITTVDQNGEEGGLSFMFDKLDPTSRTRVSDVYNILFNTGEAELEKILGSYAGNLRWCIDLLKQAEYQTCYPTLEVEQN